MKGWCGYLRSILYISMGKFLACHSSCSQSIYPHISTADMRKRGDLWQVCKNIVMLWSFWLFIGCEVSFPSKPNIILQYYNTHSNTPLRKFLYSRTLFFLLRPDIQLFAYTIGNSLQWNLSKQTEMTSWFLLFPFSAFCIGTLHLTCFSRIVLSHIF